MLGYDPESEAHMSDPAVHYRLYMGKDGKAKVICVQHFDYPDYDQTRLLSNQAWVDEGDAEEALRLLTADALSLLNAVRTY